MDRCPDLKSWLAKRKVVAHSAHLVSGMADALLPGDLLFLDDCLFSQYAWLRENYASLRSNQIDVVLGLSTELIRPAGKTPRVETSDKLHAEWHAGNLDSLAGFMAEAEIREALSLDGVWLACHGAKHLDLERVPAKAKQTIAFIGDIALARNSLKRMRLATRLFVFPYAYWQFPGSESAVRAAGFEAAFAGRDTQRIAIEELV